MNAWTQAVLMPGFALVFAAVGCALVRLAMGPTLPDRVVALDKMTVSIVAFCGLAAVWSNDPAFLDVALVLALVGFLATVALARFAERAAVRRKDDTKIKVKTGKEAVPASDAKTKETKI